MNIYFSSWILGCSAYHLTWKTRLWANKAETRKRRRGGNLATIGVGCGSRLSIQSQAPYLSVTTPPSRHSIALVLRDRTLQLFPYLWISLPRRLLFFLLFLSEDAVALTFTFCLVLLFFILPKIPPGVGHQLTGRNPPGRDHLIRQSMMQKDEKDAFGLSFFFFFFFFFFFSFLFYFYYYLFLFLFFSTRKKKINTIFPSFSPIFSASGHDSLMQNTHTKPESNLSGLHLLDSDLFSFLF